MMHADAPHPNCAYMWLEHSLNPKLQGDLAAWFGSVPAVPGACKGNALLDRHGLRDQRHRATSSGSRSGRRRSPTAATARRLRALLRVGDGLHRGARRPLIEARLPRLSQRGDRHDPPRVCRPRRSASRAMSKRRSPSASPTCQPPLRRGAARSTMSASTSLDGEFFSMLGPSGSGKTTCLRLIAGFEQPTGGSIADPWRDVGGRAALRARRQHRLPGLRAVPAHDRRRERRLWADDQEGADGRARASARRRCWSWCSSPASARASRRSSRAASASAWRWRARWSTARACCCSTSRWARSTSSCASRCRSS